MKNLCLRLPGRRTSNEILKFWLFNFSNFAIAFVKNSMKKLPGFKIYFERSDKVLLPHQYLWFEFSRHWNNGPLIFFFYFLFFFWNLHWRAFCFLNFVNYFHIKVSILLILLKCFVVDYSNGNESFTGRLFSNYGLLNKLFHFFNISFIVFFTTLLSKGS